MRTQLDGDDVSDELDPVERLVAECFACEAADRGSTVDELCARRPDLAHALRARLGALERLGLEVFERRSRDDEVPSSLGEFRLIERIGGGGMGVVYRAEQTSLGREVALKLVRPDQLFFPHARERFRREAEAVARLAHPSIIPIFSVGEAHGIPYFAMERFTGTTLARVLNHFARRAPESLRGEDLFEAVVELGGIAAPLERAPLFQGSWVEAVLRIVSSVADALEHAHQRGVLHRDVKPSNIAITPDGRALLFDFGLTTSGEGERMTRTGAQLGTLPYMSPEQLQGARGMSERSDVYSLGVTMYEMLTLQLPYRGSDALSTQELILDGRPDSIRARNREVHADVEIVCRVAMERDVARRYSSAAAFARDLDHARAKRPIAARPPGTLVRTARFARRRPAFTVAATTAALFAIATPIILLRQASRHSDALAARLVDERAARQEADDSRKLALAETRNSEETLEFLLDLFDRASPHAGGSPTMSALELVDAGASKIDSYFVDRPVARARAQWMLAKVLGGLGEAQRALPLCESAAATLEREEVSVTPQLRAQVWNTLAEMLLTTNRLERALAAAERAVQHAESTGQPAFLCDTLAMALNVDIRAGRTARAKEKLARVETLLATIEPTVGVSIALGAAYSQLDEPEHAVTAFQRALDREHSDPSVSAAEIVAARAGLGSMLERLGRTKEAEAELVRARDDARTTWGEDSEVEIASMLALARIASSRGDKEQVRTLSREAVEAAERRAGPTSQAYLMAAIARAELSLGIQDWEQARELYEVSILPLQQDSLAPEHPLIARSYRALGFCAKGLGDFAGAAQWHELEAQLQRDTGNSDGERAALESRSIALEKLGSLDEAIDCSERALEIASRTDALTDDRAVLERLARLCERAGRTDEAASHRQHLTALRDSK